MKAKIIEMLGSVRFWMTLLIAVALYLKTGDLVQALELFFGASIGIRTIDRFGEKLTQIK